MGTCSLHVTSGVCGFTVAIEASCEDMQNVTLQVETQCPNIKALAEKLPTLDAWAELGAGFEGELHRLSREAIPRGCAGCIVTAGMFRAMQVAASVALPGDAGFEFKK